MMYRRIGALLALFALLVCSIGHSKNQAQVNTTDVSTVVQHSAEVDSLVSSEWLYKNLKDPNLVILDATVQVDFSDSGELIISSGRIGYEQGHIPTSGFADLTNDLVDTSSDYPYALPSPEKFVAAMGKLGVGDNTRVVLYASNYSAWAARVWWMLRWVGFDNAAVLDGGLSAWIAAGYPLSIEAASKSTATLSIKLRPEIIAERDEVFAAISDDDVMLIDAMPAAHYRGDMAMYGRAGHIPTAINIPTVLAEDGFYLSNTLLEAIHPTDKDVRVITYCGGGISASANAFAMHRIGFTDIAVYMNSLDEWAADPANPLDVTGQ